MLCQFLPYPSSLSQSTRLSSLCYTTAFHQPSILHTVIYVSKLFSQLVPPSPSLAVSTSSFPTSTSLFTPCKQVPQYHFSRFHMLTQLRPTLCDPMDCSPPDSSIHGILQARILEWVVISFSRPRVHIYVLIYNMCFSLSDLLLSVLQALGSSTSLQLPQIHGFLRESMKQLVGLCPISALQESYMLLFQPLCTPSHAAHNAVL